jgi:DNA-binding GntR family transcriptional regulator
MPLGVEGMAHSVIELGRGPEGITVPNSATPPSKRQQIIDDIIDDVRSGRLRPGEPIPSASQLMEKYAPISITPVRQAIADLKARDLLVGAAGRAVFVAKPLPKWMVDLME